MNNRLKVKIKNVYGVEKIYPACEASALLAEIAGQKTLTERTIKLAKRLGYCFDVLAPDAPSVIDV